jgi:hypothetical protein
MIYQFDAVRWCKARARTARAVRNFADENSFVQVAREVEGLRTRLAEVEAQRDGLKEAVRNYFNINAIILNYSEVDRWDEFISLIERRQAARAAVDALVGDK